MATRKRNKSMKRQPRKTIFGIKLPPVDPTDEKIKTILDIDPEFYSIVEGRPIRPDTSIYRYKNNVKGVFLNNTCRGYLLDEIIRINREMKDESNIYETAVKHFEECQKSFDKFLAHDNDTTILIMMRSDNLAKDLANQSEERKKAHYDLAQMKSEIQYIDETLLLLFSIENFLHKCSPILWLERNKVKLDVEHTAIVTMDSDIFRKIYKEAILTRISDLPSPKLYFETPDQLVKMFSYMEEQNLHFLLQVEDLSSEKRKFIETRDKLRCVLSEELEEFQTKIDEIEAIISWTDTQEEELKELFYKILENKFEYLVSSDMVLQLMTYVEFAYEQLIAPNETKLSVLDMSRALEAEYQDLMLNLSFFDVDMIRGIEKETYQKSKEEMKRAQEASTLLRDVDKMHRRLKSAFEPSRKRVNY